MADPDVFAAVANATRRDLLRLLLDRGPQPVQELADHFAMRRPSVSEHLKVLKDAGLVTEERWGRQRLYSLEATPLRDLSDWLAPYERFWRDRLTGLRALLDAEAAAESGTTDGSSAGDAAGANAGTAEGSTNSRPLAGCSANAATTGAAAHANPADGTGGSGHTEDGSAGHEYR